MLYQKDFYSLNYNLRLTLSLSATIMGNVVRILAHHSFHKHVFNCRCSHFFILIYYLSFLSWFGFKLKKPLRCAEALAFIFLNEF